MLFAGGGVDLASPNQRFFPRTDEWKTSWDVGVNLTWTFWDFGRVKADVAEAAADQRAVRERLAEFDTDARGRGAAAAARPRVGPRGARRPPRTRFAPPTEARRVVGERFAAGVATSTEVLDAQVALLQAELDRTQALASVRLAEARLERALGR